MDDWDKLLDSIRKYEEIADNVNGAFDGAEEQYIQLASWLKELKERRMVVMRKINWSKKLTSRKLWVSVAGFVSMMIVAMGGTENDAAQVAALIMAGATVVGYVVGEGLADAANVEGEVDAEDKE